MLTCCGPEVVTFCSIHTNFVLRCVDKVTQYLERDLPYAHLYAGTAIYLLHLLAAVDPGEGVAGGCLHTP